MESNKSQLANAPTNSFLNQYDVEIFAAVTLLLSVIVLLLPLPLLAGPSMVVFIPAIVAMVIISLTKGSVRAMVFSSQAWRISLKWAGISLAVGIALRFGVWLVGSLLPANYALSIAGFTPVLITSFLFAAGEEIGWRGFALPKLLERGTRPLAAAFWLGIPWGILHLPLVLPGKLVAGAPPIGYFLITLSLSFLLAWLFLGSGHSITAPVLMHGVQNMLSFANSAMPVEVSTWVMAGVYAAAAAVLILLTRGRLGMRKAEPASLPRISPNTGD